MALWFSVRCAAQEPLRISAHFDQQPLSEVLDYFSQKYPLSFSYDTDLAATYLVDIHFDNQDLFQALALLFRESPFDFEIGQQWHVLLFPKTKTPTGQYCGTIRDALTQEPLPFANIVLVRTLRGTKSDTSGAFALPVPPHPAGFIEIRYVGYQTKRISTSEWNGEQCRDIYLDIQAQEVEPVIIKDKVLQILSSAKHGNGFQMEPQRLAALPVGENPMPFRCCNYCPALRREMN